MISRRRFALAGAALTLLRGRASRAQSIGDVETNGVVYHPEVPPKPYAFTDLGGGYFVFEVCNGDYSYSDDQMHMRNRSELVSRFRVDYGQDHWISFARRITKLPAGTHDAILGQIHVPAPHLGPALTLFTNPKGNLAIKLGYKLPLDAVKNLVVWEGGIAVPNRWEKYVIRFRQGKAGTVQVWRNGRHIVGYRGPVGFISEAASSRFQFGVYSAEITALGVVDTCRGVEFANVRNGRTSLLQFVTSPEPLRD